jgi:hypothetical protein
VKIKGKKILTEKQKAETKRKKEEKHASFRLKPRRGS